MNTEEVEQRLLKIVSKYAGRPVSPDEAIYQDAGINGADFRDVLEEVRGKFFIPPFDWEAFADTSEPPRGTSLFFGLKILPRRRLTTRHLAKVITAGKWIEPDDQ
jgi:hypothetical protein